jgi:hypothetical protein
MGEVRNKQKFYMEDLKGRDHLGDLSADVKIILKLILSRM